MAEENFDDLIEKKNYGAFRISIMMPSKDVNAYRAIMNRMDFIAFAKMYPNYVDYIAQSEIFRPVAGNEQIPAYEVSINRFGWVVARELKTSGIDLEEIIKKEVDKQF